MEEDSNEDDNSDEDEFAVAKAAAGATVPENCERSAIIPTKAAPTTMMAPAEAFKTLMVEEEENIPHLGMDMEACIPRIPVNVDFDKMETRTNDFNLQGILKHITENPWHLVLWIDW